ncbi:hypothetical protein [Bifidobacterium choloepi]|uniref:Uncharacterized protein n=1 Tax=Bifidobacterium choloepi TaxID=2614131 RepID=A0A6I5N8Y6_9BIFI|nr:hypothetical protein [Bifidobacterium choloepi]NEG70281.1 hypothetical protein [Bifidobacterium choloepi]
MTQKHERIGRIVRLVCSCLFLFVLFFLMEASCFWIPPWDWDVLSVVVERYAVGIPALHSAPVIAFFMGLWYAWNAHWRMAFFPRLAAVAGGCALNLVLYARDVIELYGWFDSITMLAVAPPFAFLVGGVLMRIGSYVSTRLRARTRRGPESGTRDSHASGAR